MPRRIDPKIKERCVRLVLETLPQYPSLEAQSNSEIENIVTTTGTGVRALPGPRIANPATRQVF